VRQIYSDLVCIILGYWRNNCRRFKGWSFSTNHS